MTHRIWHCDCIIRFSLVGVLCWNTLFLLIFLVCLSFFAVCIQKLFIKQKQKWLKSDWTLLFLVQVDSVSQLKHITLFFVYVVVGDVQRYWLIIILYGTYGINMNKNAPQCESQKTSANSNNFWRHFFLFCWHFFLFCRHFSSFCRRSHLPNFTLPLNATGCGHIYG